jgi:hypothetical protein
MSDEDSRKLAAIDRLVRLLLTHPAVKGYFLRKAEHTANPPPDYLELIRRSTERKDYWGFNFKLDGDFFHPISDKDAALILARLEPLLAQARRASVPRGERPLRRPPD